MKLTAILSIMIFPGILGTCMNAKTHTPKEYGVYRLRDTVQVAMGADFGKGYQWILKDSISGLRLVNTSYVSNDSANSITTDIQSWFFVADKKGHYNISFDYRRPWEDSTAVLKSIDFKVQIK